MKRVERDQMVFVRSQGCPTLCRYLWRRIETEFAKQKKQLYKEQVKARDLYSRCFVLWHKRNGWMTFKDRANITSNQTGKTQRDSSLQLVY